MLRALIFGLCVLLSVSNGASAQDLVPAQKTEAPTLLLKHYEPSHPEKFLLSFYKLSGQQPDFLEWAKISPFLSTTKESDRDLIINRESNRLSQTYTALDMTDPLIVHATISLDNYSTLQETLSLSEFTPKTFFKYNIYNQDIAIVPKDIAKLGTLKITNTEMEAMLAKAGKNVVVAEFLLKPIAADVREKFVIDKTSYWLLLTDIAEIRFWSEGEGDPALLWMQRADWYKPKEDKALMGLKSGGM